MVVERQGESVGAAIFHRTIEAATPSQKAGRRDELRAEVYAFHQAAEFGGKEA